MNRRQFVLSSAAVAAASKSELGAQRAPAEKHPPAIAQFSSRLGEVVPIQLAEREQRFERAQALLRSVHADALVITTGTSLAYFTGTRWTQLDRFSACILPTRGTPFFVCPAFEEVRIREKITQKPATMPQADKVKFYTWNEDEDPFATLVVALRDNGIATGTLAIEERTQFIYSDGMAKAAPSLTLVSGNPVTYGCRGIKSPSELALLKLANEVTLSVYRALYHSVHPGMTNNEAIDLVERAYLRCGFTGGLLCQVDQYTARPHGSLEPQVFHEGSIVLLDDGCSVEGYQSDITRMILVGKPSPARWDTQRKVFDIVKAAQAAALAKAHPGVPCEEIDAAARDVIVSAGYGPGFKYFSHRLGHGIGMDGHEYPYLVGGNALPLAPGMVFSDEPGIYIPGDFGVRLEDCWHVTEDGGHMFTPPSPSLDHPFADA